MGKISEALQGSTKFDEAQLHERASECLKRNGGSPAKAIASFVTRLGVPEIRALIGAEYISAKALAYLEARATEMKPASAQAEEVGGVHALSESHDETGPADDKPVPVTAHSRNKPGNARYGLEAAQAAAKAAPAAFAIILSNGDDLLDYTEAQGARFLDTTTYEGALVWLCKNYAQAPSPTAKYRDYIPTEKFREFREIGRAFQKFVGVATVPVTIDVYVAMRQQQLQIENQVSA